MHRKLISFAICPYVQRSVITLRFKGIDFELTYIDIKNKPDWFLALSPLGKVPVLQVDGSTVVFESAVINEFLDETTEPRLHPSDPLQRAHNRSWIEFGSALLADFFAVMVAPTEDAYQVAEGWLFDRLARLEENLGPGPYFNGEKFSLVDAAYAPLFMRLSILREIREMPRWASLPRISAWSEALLALAAVRESVVTDFRPRFLEHLREKGSVLTQGAA